MINVFCDICEHGWDIKDNKALELVLNNHSTGPQTTIVYLRNDVIHIK